MARGETQNPAHPSKSCQRQNRGCSDHFVGCCNPCKSAALDVAILLEDVLQRTAHLRPAGGLGLFEHRRPHKHKHRELRFSAVGEKFKPDAVLLADFSGGIKGSGVSGQGTYTCGGDGDHFWIYGQLLQGLIGGVIYQMKSVHFSFDL